MLRRVSAVVERPVVSTLREVQSNPAAKQDSSGRDVRQNAASGVHNPSELTPFAQQVQQQLAAYKKAQEEAQNASSTREGSSASAADGAPSDAGDRTKQAASTLGQRVNRNDGSARGSRYARTVGAGMKVELSNFNQGPTSTTRAKAAAAA
jgi:hypothetical protein